MMKALKGAVNQAKGFFDNYKAPFLLLFLLVACATTYGQVDTTKTLQRINALGYQYKNIDVDSSFMIPQDTFKLRYADSSGIAIKKGVMYRWTGKKWVAIARKLTDSTVIFNGDTLKISGTVSSGSGGSSASPDKITTVAENTTVSSTYNIYLVNTAGGAVTITIPPSAIYSSGTVVKITIKKITNNFNSVTISPPTGLINGASSYVLTVYNESVTIVSDGTNLYTL